MPIKILKPTTPGRRKYSVNAFTELTGDKPHKPLIAPLKKHAGRNNTGRITVRHRGGGHKRRYRVVDFRRVNKIGVPATVQTIEYDPNRSAFISLIYYKDGEKKYILAYKDMEVGDSIIMNPKGEIKIGNRMMLKNIPVSYKIFNLEFVPGKGGQMVRSAGSSAVLVSLDGKMAQVQLPSGEVRYFAKDSYATIGEVSDSDHSQIRIGKAGRSRWLGRRPQVLGKSMNVVDHPHGGGEGHSPIGMKYPKTPWGAHALGVRTRNKKKRSGVYIVASRHKRKK